MNPEIASLAPLSHPIELLEVKGTRTVSLRVEHYERGTVTIEPKRGGGPVTLEALRLFGVRVNAPTKVPYLDITQSTLIRALLPFLDNPVTAHRVMSISRRGRGAKSIYTLQVGEI
jgi:hypothetical protein